MKTAIFSLPDGAIVSFAPNTVAGDTLWKIRHQYAPNNPDANATWLYPVIFVDGELVSIKGAKQEVFTDRECYLIEL